MIALGLTGSIGMGKTTAARMFSEAGVPVFSADEAVHQLYRGAAVPVIEAEFPGTTRDGAVDRELLSQAVLDDPKKLSRLEAIIHPLVRQAERDFLDAARAAGALLAVLEIPLLYEAGDWRRFDAIAVVSAPESVQRERVLARPGMTEEKFQSILRRQMTDDEKRMRADIVIETGCGTGVTREAVEAVIQQYGGGRQGAKTG